MLCLIQSFFINTCPDYVWKNCRNQKKVFIKTVFCCVLENLKEIKKYKYSIFRYNRFDLKKWCTLKKRYILPTPFFFRFRSSVLPSHTNQIFFLPILYLTFSFLFISFSFSWNVHWWLSLFLYIVDFTLWLWRVASGEFVKHKTTKLTEKREKRFLNRIKHWNIYYFRLNLTL